MPPIRNTNEYAIVWITLRCYNVHGDNWLFRLGISGANMAISSFKYLTLDDYIKLANTVDIWT